MRRSPRLLPDRLFVRALAMRLPVLWVLVRLAFLIVELLALSSMGGAGAVPPTPFIAPVSAVGIALLVATLVVIDVRRRGEHVLLANLGTGTRMLFALGSFGALLLESAVAAVGRVAQSA